METGEGEVIYIRLSRNPLSRHVIGAVVSDDDAVSGGIAFTYAAGGAGEGVHPGR